MFDVDAGHTRKRHKVVEVTTDLSAPKPKSVKRPWLTSF
jgi:hypothetical protein